MAKIEKVEKTESIKNLTYKEVSDLKEIFDIITIEGVKDEFISDVLIIIGNVASSKDVLDSKLKAIGDKVPQIIKDLQADPNKSLSDDEQSIINRTYAKWQGDLTNARNTLLSQDSDILISEVKLFTKDVLIDWIKSNKKVLHATKSSTLFKLLLKV